MIRLISFLFAGFLAMSSLLSTISCAQSTETSDCLITESSCPCSETDASGTCMRYQGDAKCLLDECQESYKCDCLGYQMCRKSSCAVYTSMEDAIPSETEPFGCHLTPGAGSCTTFLSILDTVVAAGNAREDARLSNSELVDHGFAAQQAVMDVQNDIVAINNALEELHGIKAYMTSEEETEIFTDAQNAKDLGIECEQKSLDISLSSRDALQLSITAKDLAHLAADAEADAKKADEKLLEEDANAKKENRACTECDKLKRDIERLRAVRKEAAINAGKAAKSCRDKRNKGKAVLHEIHEKRMKCRDVREKVVSKIAEIKKRHENANE